MIRWVISLILIITCVVFDYGTPFAIETVGEVTLSDAGVPVRSVNWVRLHVGANRDGDPVLYATMGQNAKNLFLLQIDPASGRYRTFISDVPQSNFPTATLMSRSGILYVGGAYAGHLLCFDPEKDTFEDLGAIAPGAATFPCRIDEDADGRIWIGSYGTADLTRYDPKTGQFTRYGRMDEVDMYNYPLVNTDGTVANLIRMTKPHVVVFDPKTGEKKSVGPVTTKGEGSLDLLRGGDGKLYIDSSEGRFRIDGFVAVPVDTIPAPKPAPTLPDGSTFAFTDGSSQIFRTLEIRIPDGTTRTFTLDYEASGSDIFYLHAGPDGCVYGSSYLPLHLFRYDPRNSELADLGQCSSSAGEAYSMANLDGKIYISSYPAARISIYDPGQPYHFGLESGNNPRDIGPIDDISYRPRSTLAGPMGRVWVASIPDYGRWGGPLSYYDPKTEEKKAYYRIWGDGSCYTLAHLEEQKLLAVGTNISGGSGTKPKVDQAVLFLWDYQNEKKVWEGTPERPVSSFNALLAGPGGNLYGTIRGNGKDELFAFDPTTHEFTNRVELPESGPLDLGLQNGPDGKIYGFTHSSIYRLDPETMKVETVVREENAFDVAGPIVGKRIYFSTGHRLRAATLFK